MSTASNDGVGGRIAEAIQLAGSSNNSLAKRLAEEFGDDAPKRQAIADYIAGKSSPTAATILAVSAVLNVRPEWLLTGRGERVRSFDLVRVLTPDVDRWLPESVKVRVREEAELCGYMHAPTTGEAQEIADGYSAGAMYLAFWLELAVGKAAYSMGRGDLPAATVAAIAAREGLTQGFADALLQLCAAHRNIALTLQGEPVAPSPSVAPSVGKPHKKAENGPKRPKSKKGQPRG